MQHVRLSVVLCNSRRCTYVVSGLRNIEVYAIQGCNKRIVNVTFLGPRDGVLFIEVSVFRGSTVLSSHVVYTYSSFITA